METSLLQLNLAMRRSGDRILRHVAQLIAAAIGKMTFPDGPRSIGVTVSGGTTEIKAKDTWATAMGRLEESLRQAKQAGGNRVFCHDGKEATLVESPNLGATEREIALS